MTWGPGTLVVFSLIYCSHTSVLGSRMRIICQGYMFPFLCFSLSLLKYHEDLYIRECFWATLLFERAFPADSRERIISCYIIFKHVIVRTVTVDVSSSNLQASTLVVKPAIPCTIYLLKAVVYLTHRKW